MSTASVIALFFLAPGAIVQAEVTARESSIFLPTYPWDPPVRHPYFRETDGKNIYPYPMMDNLSRERETRRWRTVVLENEYLRVTFLPDLGGKVWEVLDKTTSRPVFYVNHVVKPGLIGQCGAWVSGGIEFNTGPAGHTVSAVLPIDVEILPAARDGSRSVAVGEVERVYGTRWTVVVTLRPGRSFLEETIRIYNRTERVRPYYFWNCTAVPDTPGFRFIYPMTLGTDHAGTTFFTWPLCGGRDLRLGRSYEDAASIFAYRCNQDFFGSYDDDEDRGVVAVANHRVLPGKKAWTWGRGSYGSMHQKDLTDDDGPYNEVQTGPLPTQADVGRLDPQEAMAWTEHWYPVHGLGGFTFANRDVVANATIVDGFLRVRVLGTGTWDPVRLAVLRDGVRIGEVRTGISPRAPARIRLPISDVAAPLEVALIASDRELARFSVPLDLPERKPPGRAEAPRTASELSRAGWRDILFARIPEAISRLGRSLEDDPSCPDAHAGLAMIELGPDPEAASLRARAALQTDPDHGLARYFLALAELRLGREPEALEHAWRAGLDPRTAVPARALVGKLLLRAGDWRGAVSALSVPGPWETDPITRNRLALAHWRLGHTGDAEGLASRSLAVDPLDALARCILWLVDRECEGLELGKLIRDRAQPVLELAATLSDLGLEEVALELLEEFYTREASGNAHPLVAYWAAWLASRLGRDRATADYLEIARSRPTDGVFPHRLETVAVLRWALEEREDDGKAALYLGHLLFSLRRHEEARELWRRAVDLGAAPAVALRALARARWRLDGDVGDAVNMLREARRAAPDDVIVARDLARALFELAEGAEGASRRELVSEARATLTRALAAGRGRSDFVALLARSLNELGDYGATARLLDSVRITIWEGAREAHDLFEEAHVALGREHLESGRPADALRELDRALEYPENLATGRLEGAREAHIHYLRGRALAALERPQEAIAAWRRAADEAPSEDDASIEEGRRLAREALERLETDASR